MDSCLSDYGYQSSGGYIYNVTSFCNSPEQYQAWVAPPPPAAKPASRTQFSDNEEGPSVPAPKPRPPGSETEKPETEKPKTACTLSSARSTCKRTAATPTQPKTSTGTGINGTCQQASDSNVKISQDWGRIASDCTDAITSCTNSCSGADLTACNGLQEYVDEALDQQNIASASGGASGLGCQAKSSDMNPASQNPNNNPNNNPSAMSPSSAANSGDCSINPVACQNQQNNQQRAVNDTGTNSGMVGASMAHGIANATGMNVGGDLSAGKQGPNFGTQNSASPSAGMVPSMMGGGGSSGSGFGMNNNNSNAAAGPSGRGGMRVASKDDKADVLKGERGGQGGYSGARGIASVEERRRRGGAGGMGNLNFGGGVDEFGRMRGLDLKAYLPGGRQDPNRRMGGTFGRNPDVHAAHENLFNVVSTRFQVHCKLQMLYGCR